MKILNMVIPILIHFSSLFSNWNVPSRIKPHVIPKNCDVINDIKLFPTVYCRINCRKFLTLSNQTSRYKSKSWFSIPIKSLMQVKKIAECSNGNILQYFWPPLSYHIQLRHWFCLFLSGRLRQVLLYMHL